MAFNRKSQSASSSNNVANLPFPQADAFVNTFILTPNGMSKLGKIALLKKRSLHSDLIDEGSLEGLTLIYELNLKDGDSVGIQLSTGEVIEASESTSEDSKGADAYINIGVEMEDGESLQIGGIPLYRNNAVHRSLIEYGSLEDVCLESRMHIVGGTQGAKRGFRKASVDEQLVAEFKKEA